MLRVFAFLIFILFLPHQVFAQNNTDEAMEFAYESIGQSIISLIEMPEEKRFADPDGLIILLGEIDSDEARNLLIELLGIYIGESHGEALNYAIQRQGKKIQKALEANINSYKGCFIRTRFKTNLECLEEESIKEISKNLLLSISQGKLPEYPI